MKTFRNIALILLVLIASILVAIGIIYNNKIAPVDTNDTLVAFKIPKGSSLRQVGELLEKKGLIKDEKFFYIFVKLNDIENLEAATYKLSSNMGIKKIIETIQAGGIDRIEISITFREGLNMRGIANIIAKNTTNSYEEVLALVDDETYIDEMISKYWYLTNDIKNDKIYYPLEGYLFPETYRIYEDSSVEDIFAKMLDHTSKVLEKYKTKMETSNYSIHEIMTLASIIELEGASSNDRAQVAGVFYNRIKKGWTLGSDVTGYYGAKMDDWTNGLGKHINDCNGYNTRGNCVKALPVGPICNPGSKSIDATLNPANHNYYYFVADCNGKTYLNKNETGHNNTIAKLVTEGNWCDK